MAAAASRPALGSAEVGRAVRRALARAAAGRLSAAEREWLGRVEARRRVLATQTTPVNPRFERGADQMPGWTGPPGGTYAVDGLSMMFSIPPEWGRLLFCLVRECRPGSCVELGTAFGLSSAYQAAALELNGAGRLVTVDAAREWGAIASEGFEQLGLAGRATFVAGQIGDVLPEVAESAAPVDFAFLDAEHQADPTLGYFETLAPRLGRRAVVVLDDIGFKGSMGDAWGRIRSDPRISASIDVSRLGIAVCG